MSYTVRAAPPAHFSWLRSRTGVELTESFRAIEALDDIEGYCYRCGLRHGCVRGMVGYEGWTPNSVRMHVCIETPGALKAILGPAFEYPFIEGKKKMVIGVTPGDNVQALKFNRHIGFREVYREKDGFADGVDLVVQRFTRSEWEAKRAAKKVYHGHEERSPAA